MVEPMSPSKSITKGQAGKFCDVLADALVKSGLPSEETQKVLETQGVEIAEEFVQSVRERLKMISKIVVRRVVVWRNRTQQEMLDAMGRTQYVNSEVVGLIPGKGDSEGEEDVYFIPLKGKDTSAEAVQALLDKYGLKPDGYAVGAVNEADPAFADSHPNFTQWVDENGKHCYVAFNRWLGGERIVDVSRYESAWYGRWLVGGVRK